MLEFASTSAGRSTVFWAAMAFAACHLVALATEPSAANLNGVLQQQLIFFGAVLCRFVLPLSILVAGVASHVTGKLRRNVSSSRPRSP